MPAKRRYKCLNPDCPSITDAAKDMTFVAFNVPMPSCPHCACIRLEDWGAAINIMGGASASTKSNDSNLRALAERHNLTDMSNRNGNSVKSNARTQEAPLPQQFQQTTKLNGIDVPFGAGCVNVPSMARKLNPSAGGQTNFAGGAKIGDMTKVVGTHTG